MTTAYAWSQRGSSYFVSTCGRKEIHEDNHMANFEDDSGKFNYKEINNSSGCHDLHEVLPLIDECHRMR